MKKNFVNNYNSARIPWIDSFRGLSMLFLFFHHFTIAIINADADKFFKFNVFAEVFVILAGVVIGSGLMVRRNDLFFIKRGVNILLVYYIYTFFAVVAGILFGYFNGSLKQAIFDILFLNENFTTIGILRLYGPLFVMSPVIHWFFRRSKLLLLVISLFIFLMAIFIEQNYVKSTDSYFIRKTLPILAEWQVFYVIGLFVGVNIKKINQFAIENKNIFIFFLIVCAPILLILVDNSLSENSKQKFPYSPTRILYLLGVFPVTLCVLLMSHLILIKTKLDRCLEVIYRNSIISFLVSDLIYIPLRMLFKSGAWQLGELDSTLLAATLALLSPLFVKPLVRVWAYFRMGFSSNSIAG